MKFSKIPDMLSPKYLSLVLAIVIAGVTTAFISFLPTSDISTLFVCFTSCLIFGAILIYFALDYLVFKEVNLLYDRIKQIKKKNFSVIPRSQLIEKDNPIALLTEELNSYVTTKEDEVKELRKSAKADLVFMPPVTKALEIQADVPTFVYTHYTLDPTFHEGEVGNSILVLEPSHFAKHPMAPKTIEFILSLAENIPGMQIYYGEYSDLPVRGMFRDHPINAHFQGVREEHPTLAPGLVGEFNSFFSFWNKLSKKLS